MNCNSSNWINTTIGEQCLVIAGQSPKGKYYNTNNNGLPFYQGKKEFSARYIGSPTKWTTNITKEAIVGDILMSVRAPVGPINFSTQKICIGRGLAAIRVGEKIDKDFLFYFLLSKQDEICGHEGAVFASINKKQIESIKLYLPFYSEQKYIIRILDKAFVEINQAIANTEKNLTNARELFKSYLNNIFIQTDDNWEEKKLKDFTKSISTGPFGSLLHKSDYTSHGDPIVNPINLIDGKIIPNPLKLIDKSTKERLGSYILNEGDIVVARRGEIGRCAVVDSTQTGWICGTGSFFIRPLTNINSDFLAHLLRSTKYKDKLLSVATGATMKNISNKALSNLMIFIPQLNTQVKILRNISDLEYRTKELENIYQQKLNALNELKQSILQKAFTGKLTMASNQQQVTI